MGSNDRRSRPDPREDPYFAAGVDLARRAREEQERQEEQGASFSYPPAPVQGRPGDGNPHNEPAHAPSPLERLSKNWVALVAIVVGASTLIDIGIRIAARNESYATKVELERVNQRLDGIAKTLDEIKVSDIKPLATKASENALEAQAKVAALDKTVTKVVKSIAGFNARAAARHQITPLPLQDE